MAITRPTGEQLRFRSQYTGDHVLDTYLESAEKGGRSISDLLDDLFDSSGVFREENFEFKFDETNQKLQYRVGNFANASTGWADLTTFFGIKGAFNSAVTYNNYDLVNVTNKDVYIVYGLSSGTTFSDEASFTSSSYTHRLIDVSEAREWASQTDGIVRSTDYSAKAWAIGGTDVTETATRGPAKDWAIKTDGAVDTAEYSAKAWSIGGTGIDNTASRGSSKDWATKTAGSVDTAEFSSKAWAIGGTNVTNTANRGASKEWATKTASNVDGTEFSAKEYAQGTQSATGGSAKSWAVEASGISGGATNDRSAKDWAQGANMTGATLQGSAKDWAQYTAGTVDGTNYSAKYWATHPDVTVIVNNIADINTVENSISSVNTVATNIADVNTLATTDNMADINTVADEINNNNLQTVANDIAAVVTTANDLNEATSEIETVAASITNVDAVGPSIANVNTVAPSIANVDTVAGDITNVNTVATDITNVNYVAGIRDEVVKVADQYTVGASAPATAQEGDLWYKTTDNTLHTYDGSQWQETTNFNKLLITDYKYTIAAATQTSFSGADDNAVTLAFDGSATERIDVFLNGILLDQDDDYTYNASTDTLTLNDSAVLDDVLVIRKFLTATATELGVLASDLEKTSDWRKEAESWATETGDYAQTYTAGVASDNTDYSAKEWAIGTTVPTGSSKDWATETGAQVDGSEYSAKEYALGTTVPAGSSKDWATQTGAYVDGSGVSAKEWSIGTFVTEGSAKDWATETGAQVDGADYSAKEYAIGTTVAVGSSKDWATETGAQVDGSEYSAKEWAIGTTVPSGSAKDWSITAQNTTVDGTDYSAMHWALTAADTYDAFDDRYLGSKATEPTVDNDGDALQTGALFWDTAASQLKVYNGTLWEAIENQAMVGITDTSTTSQMTVTNSGIAIGPNGPHAALHIQNSDLPQLLLDGGSSTTGDIVVPDGEILQVGHWDNATTTYTPRFSVETAGTFQVYSGFNATRADNKARVELGTRGVICHGDTDGNALTTAARGAINSNGGQIALIRSTTAGTSDPYFSFHDDDGTRLGYLQITDTNTGTLRIGENGQTAPGTLMFGTDTALTILQGGIDTTTGRVKLRTGSNSNGVVISSDDLIVYDHFSAGYTRTNDDSGWSYNTGENGIYVYSATAGVTNASDTYSYMFSRTVADSSDAFQIRVDNNPKVEIDATGNAYTDGTWSNTAADYAEMFEWADGNPDADDRIGHTVVLDETNGNMIRLSTSSDPQSAIIGVVSGAPAVIGDNAHMKWVGWGQVDDWNRPIQRGIDVVEWGSHADPDNSYRRYRVSELPEDIVPPEDAVYKTVYEQDWNPDWDQNQEYTPRIERQEWDAIGLVGKLRIHAGQTVGDRWIKMRTIKFDTDGTTPLIEEWLVR